MQFFDTHAHIGLIIEDPIEQLIIAQEAKQDNVNKIISISNNLRERTIRSSLNLISRTSTPKSLARFFHS